ncbi:MAG: 30S ribosomal protein S8e [Candidatus Diapherotrites archaeon]|nr:30S ribosomal protein S8e [Candidatus Diapherotrites archaeon]
MTQWHLKSEKKSTGGRRTSNRRSDKILAWKGGDFTATTVDAEKDERKVKSGIGSTTKVKQKKAKTASVIDKATKKALKAEIVSVVENAANRHYVRRNTITKNAVIVVKINGEERKARVTSRPGQSGEVQAVLI